MNCSNDDNQIPFFHLLCDDDKRKYMELHEVISKSEKRYKRYKRVESLQDALKLIYEFTIRNDEEDWKRCLVCGLCFICQDIAINIRQICFLTSKCKSSINGALSKMGYKTVPFKSSSRIELYARIPYLNKNFYEQKQWTIRKKSANSI